MMRPETALPFGLYICTDVRKNEPALPAVEPTTAMMRRAGAEGVGATSVETALDAAECSLQLAAWLFAVTR